MGRMSWLSKEICDHILFENCHQNLFFYFFIPSWRIWILLFWHSVNIYLKTFGIYFFQWMNFLKIFYITLRPWLIFSASSPTTLSLGHNQQLEVHSVQVKQVGNYEEKKLSEEREIGSRRKRCKIWERGNRNRKRRVVTGRRILFLFVCFTLMCYHRDYLFFKENQNAVLHQNDSDSSILLIG